MPSKLMNMSTKDPSGRVSHLLHTLRGQDYRRLQNQRRSRSHVTAGIPSLRSINGPTLPPLDHDTDTHISSDPLLFISHPKPPPSWLKEPTALDPREALSPILSIATHNTSAVISDDDLSASEDILSNAPVMPLRILCMELIRREGGLADLEITSWIPDHLKRLFSRYAALYPHSAFDTEEIEAMPMRAPCGEVVVSGRVRQELEPEQEPNRGGGKFKISTGMLSRLSSTSLSIDEEEEWDDVDADSESPVLRTLILFDVLSTGWNTLVIQMAPSITHLALVHLDQTVPIWRLPPILPLLQALDVSYNEWVGSAKVMEKTPWIKWTRLMWLNVRECGLKREAVRENLDDRFKRWGTLYV